MARSTPATSPAPTPSPTAVFRQFGIARVDGLDELTETAAMFARTTAARRGDAASGAGDGRPLGVCSCTRSPGAPARTWPTCSPDRGPRAARARRRHATGPATVDPALPAGVEPGRQRRSAVHRRAGPPDPRGAHRRSRGRPDHLPHHRGARPHQPAPHHPVRRPRPPRPTSRSSSCGAHPTPATPCTPRCCCPRRCPPSAPSTTAWRRPGIRRPCVPGRLRVRRCRRRPLRSGPCSNGARRRPWSSRCSPVRAPRRAAGQAGAAGLRHRHHHRPPRDVRHRGRPGRHHHRVPRGP